MPAKVKKLTVAIAYNAPAMAMLREWSLTDAWPTTTDVSRPSVRSGICFSSLSRSAVNVDGMAVGAFGLLGQEWKKALGHRCDRFGTGGGVVCFLTGPQLCHPNRVRVLRSSINAVGQQTAVITASAEPFMEQGDQLVAPPR
jgi:hypothetical protein